MEFNLFVEKYFDTHAHLHSAIKSFEKRRNVTLFKKLLADKNEINFFSWLSECRLGLDLDAFCSDIFYDSKIDDKTPDWKVVSNHQIFIAEVLKINTTEEETISNIETQKKIRQFQDENPGVQFIIKGEAKTLSSEWFYGAQTKLTNKELKYRGIIRKYKLPFIICIEPALQTFINEDDTFDFLIAYNKKGFFYQDENFGKNVTGVLLRTYFNKLFYYHNELADYQLNEVNLDVLKNINCLNY